MASFERFDLNGRAATHHEIARRWRDFHREVRTASSSPLARLIGPLLGDDTRRRRVLERWRPAPSAPQSVDLATVTRFPDDLTPMSWPTSHEEAWHERVALVDVADDDPVSLYHGLTDAITSDREWVLVVGPEARESLSRVVPTLLARGEAADVVFADEVGDRPGTPILKPHDVGPHTLLSYNLIGRPALLRRETIARVGGVRREAGRALEHDLYLRLLAEGARFTHLPLVAPGRSRSERHSPDLGPDTRQVVAEALLRRGVVARVAPGPTPSLVEWTPLPEHWPRVEVLIPTRDRVDLLSACVASVEASTYPNLTITILDNSSIEPATREYFATSAHRVLDCAGPFNYAAIINRGVAHSDADYIVTLNNDAVVIQSDWLERLLGVATLDDVAIVGATLIDGRGVHEHDGIVIAPYPQHVRRGVNYLVDDEWINARRDVAAVTGAVQVFERRRYQELAGMDEDLAVVMNDVDLCLRAQSDGRRVVMVPDVVVTHHASSTRGRLDPLKDRNHFVRRWDVFGTLRDPFAPEALRLLGTRFVYRPPVPD